MVYCLLTVALLCALTHNTHIHAFVFTRVISSASPDCAFSINQPKFFPASWPNYNPFSKKKNPFKYFILPQLLPYLSFKHITILLFGLSKQTWRSLRENVVLYISCAPPQCSDTQYWKSIVSHTQLSLCSPCTIRTQYVSWWLPWHFKKNVIKCWLLSMLFFTLLSSFSHQNLPKVLSKILLESACNKVITKIIKARAQMDFDYRWMLTFKE